MKLQNVFAALSPETKRTIALIAPPVAAAATYLGMRYTGQNAFHAAGMGMMAMTFATSVSMFRHQDKTEGMSQAENDRPLDHVCVNTIAGAAFAAVMNEPVMAGMIAGAVGSAAAVGDLIAKLEIKLGLSDF